MERRPLQYVAEACAGELRNAIGTEYVQGVTIDSRRAQAGDLFVALAGEQVDGHRFVGDALARGAAAALVTMSRTPDLPPGLGPLVAAPDARRGLGQLARRYSAEFAAPRIVVGGSNGKTSTKELIAAVLRSALRVVWSEASYNNDIGVPLTLLKMNGKTQAVVCEVGTNHPGELEPLVRLVRPQFGVIPHLGREHLEFFGDIHRVIEEESWVARLLPKDGALFVNGDIDAAAQVEAQTAASVQRVGLGPKNDWRVRPLRLSEQGTVFEMNGPDARYDGEYQCALVGFHQAVNAGLAIALGSGWGLSPERIREGLQNCPGAKWRLQPSRIGGVQFLDDSYNANADSMRAALETLQRFPTSGRRIAVLGPMAELGESTESAQREVGTFAAQAGLDCLVAAGTGADVLAEAARRGGLPEVRVVADAVAAAEWLVRNARSGDLILVKASRSARFEQIGVFLRENPPAPQLRV